MSEQQSGQVMTHEQMISTQTELIGLYERVTNLKKLTTQLESAIESHSTRLKQYNAAQAELLKPAN